jgi:hypothetical protein
LEGEGQLLRQRPQKKLAKLPLHLPLRTQPMMVPEEDKEKILAEDKGLKGG